MHKLSGFLFLFLFFIPSSQAGLQNEINSMFGSMTNSTAPTAYIGTRRGVLSGGRITMKNKIVNANLIGFTPPSFGGGCGGIDMFAGSFSFISLDQLVQLLRAVASNAASYAFDIALGAICKDCQEIMKQLQGQIAKMNKFLGNSCKMAKYLVDKTGVPSAISEQLGGKVSLNNVAKGFGDAFETFTDSTGITPMMDAVNNDPDAVKKIVSGNLVWRELKKNNVASWFNSGGDDVLLRSLMSITGSFIIKAPTDSEDGTDKVAEPVPLPSILGVRELLYGGRDAEGGGKITSKIYTCTDGVGEDQCLTTGKEDVVLEGIVKKIEDLVTAPGTGIVAIYSSNSGSLTNEQKAFIQYASSEMTMLRNIARRAPGMALVFAQQITPSLALDLVNKLVFDMFGVVKAGVKLSDHSYAGKMHSSLQDNEQTLSEEYMRILTNTPNRGEIFAFYRDVLSSLDKPALMTVGSAPH